ncbi:hypothetical protein BDF19DRAFT_434952 [Syncephalis fuscata]|nr:hypothetical protein BDF19DRAFT_434952 [Syncephalis fuscata]
MPFGQWQIFHIDAGAFYVFISSSNFTIFLYILTCYFYFTVTLQFGVIFIHLLIYCF